LPAALAGRSSGAQGEGDDDVSSPMGTFDTPLFSARLQRKPSRWRRRCLWAASRWGLRRSAGRWAARTACGCAPRAAAFSQAQNPCCVCQAG
jgi:hypothetical protein